MRIAITGTSGVGKTYLEQLLTKELGFVQLPKTTNRHKRPNEIDGQGIKFRSRNDIENEIDKYFFYLEYMENIYVWEKMDLKKNKNCTIAITLESMGRLLDLKLKFIPILLYIDVNNLSLIKKRIKRQLGYKDLSLIDKNEADIIINKRMELAHKESETINKYIELISKRSKKGRAFKIIDDTTLIKEVIPYIKSLL